MNALKIIFLEINVNKNFLFFQKIVILAIELR